MTWSAAPEVVVNSRPFPDDGIPLLTDVVDAAEYPQAMPPSDNLDGHDDADDEPKGPPSLAMFPELEADSPSPPASPPATLIAAGATVPPTEAEVAHAKHVPSAEAEVSHAQYVPPAEMEVSQAQYAPPAEMEVAHAQYVPPTEAEVSPAHHKQSAEAEVLQAQHEQSAPAPTAPVPLQAWMDSLATLRGHAAGMTDAAATPMEASPVPSGPESFPDPTPTSASAPQESPPRTGFSSIATESPAAMVAPYQSFSVADHGTDHPTDHAAASAFSNPAKAGPLAEAALPDTSGVPAPAPAREPFPMQSSLQMETRIFESIAARMDKLLDQRLEAVVPGVVEAALAGVTAGLAASVRQALREAVEHAVRDEFAKHHPEEF